MTELIDAKLDRKKKVGRPKLRWLDDVQADINTTEMKGWTRNSKTDQNGWMTLEWLR
jgi:hypothetical protein